MFKSLFKAKSKKIDCIYLAGWEVRLNGNQQCENFIASQITNKETIEAGCPGIELVFEDNQLVRAWNFVDGERDSIKRLDSDELGLALPDFPPNKIGVLSENPKGKHQLGGEIPAEFNLPDNDCLIPFQYLGFISKEDPNFNWLPFTLHLTAPIFLNMEQVFLDYSESAKPVIINKEEVEATDTSYEDDLNKDSEIVFQPTPFNFKHDTEFSSSGNAGIPNWIQYPTIPMCPKSGKRMKFVCQLNGGIPTLRKNVVSEDEWNERYYSEMNFWGDGDLFVFFEPSSKVACYFIQNT